MGVVVGDFKRNVLDKFLNKVTVPHIQRHEKSYEHCVKADALRIKDYFYESIDEYLNALSFDENNPEAYKGMALSYKKLGDFEKAIGSLHKARKLTPFDKSIYFELGECFVSVEKACCAVKHYVKAIKLDRGFIEAQFKLGVAHELLEEDDVAIMIYNKIIETTPSYIAAYNHLASLYMRLDRHYEAIKVFKDILGINPEFARAYLGLGVAYDKQERFGEALRFYSKYLEMKPKSGNAEHIIDRINCIRYERQNSGENRHLKLV